MGKCPKCGKELKCTKQESGIVYCCEKCNYSIATTNIDSIFEDQKQYSITLLEDNKSCIDIIKVISHITNKNFIESKKLLESAPCIIFIGDAVSILKVKNELNNKHIRFSIYPKFIY